MLVLLISVSKKWPQEVSVNTGTVVDDVLLRKHWLFCSFIMFIWLNLQDEACNFNFHLIWLLLGLLTCTHVMPWLYQYIVHAACYCLPTIFLTHWSLWENMIFKLIMQKLTNENSTLFQVMAWCCQATSHYLRQHNQPRSVLLLGVTRQCLWNYTSTSAFANVSYWMANVEAKLFV